MDQYYQNIYSTIAYNWISNLKYAKKDKSSKSICFCKNNYHAKISFFDKDIIELTALDKNTNKNIFYLHFQINNLKILIDNIKVLFNCLEQNDHKQQIKINNKDCKILLVCSTGLSTAYYVYLLENYLNKHNLNIEINAVGYHELEAIQNRYNYIFVAPQISYQYHNLYERYGDKVKLIDSYDFATGNISAILNIL